MTTLENVLKRAREHRLAEEFPYGVPTESAIVEDAFLEPPPETTESVTADELTTLGLIELILKDRPRLDQAIRNPALQRLLVPKFLTIALLSFFLFGVCLVIMFNAAGIWPELTAMKTVFDAAQSGQEISFLKFVPDTVGVGRWLDGSAWQLILAYSLGLVAATGVCLPSLYFYGLLAGVRMSMVDVVLHSVKAKATGAVGLIGILPMYAAVGMGVIILSGAVVPNSSEPGGFLRMALWLGLILPFIGGLFGTWSMYRGFLGLADTLPAKQRSQRECFLNRLAISWVAVYTAVTPLMIFTLWEFFGRTS
jgi:hypothetical protein